jgi:hypothetical protein
MTNPILLIAIAALASISPASALTSMPARNLSSIARATTVAEPAARRQGAPHRHRGTPSSHGYRSYGVPYTYTYPYGGYYPEYREYGSPPSTAAPMERVPQIAPLAPRIGQ